MIYLNSIISRMFIFVLIFRKLAQKSGLSRRASHSSLGAGRGSPCQVHEGYSNDKPEKAHQEQAAALGRRPWGCASVSRARPPRPPQPSRAVAVSRKLSRPLQLLLHGVHHPWEERILAGSPHCATAKVRAARSTTADALNKGTDDCVLT